MKLRNPLYQIGHTATIRNVDGSRFCNGRLVLVSEPHVSDERARDWAWAFEPATELVSVTSMLHHKSRIVN
jgi:hypothetical protein